MTIASLIKFELCEDVLEKCPFSSQPTVCTDRFCNNNNSTDYASCVSDFPVAGACCGKANAPACLADFQANHDNDPDRDGACARVREALLECNSVSGFSTLAPTAQASCLCYNKASSYVPTSWDNAATSCYLSGSSAHPVLYSLLVESSSLALGLCTKVLGPATANATATTKGATGAATAATATATSGAVGVTGSTVSTGSTITGSAPSATQTKSAGVKTHGINRRLLVTGLFLVFPSMLMAATM